MPSRRLAAPWLMTGSSLLFALMGLCVKTALLHHDLGEVVLVRAGIGAVLMAAVVRTRGTTLRSPVPWMHAWRSIIGVTALSLWFGSMGGLPLATAVTLNYMSSVWIALFLIGGATLLRDQPVDGRLVATVLAGFLGVALALHPTLARDQLPYGLAGLASGVLSAMAILQVRALGRVGEPEDRVVFYFSLGGALMGLMLTLTSGGFHRPSVASALALAGAGLSATVAQWMMTRAYALGRPLVNASLQYLGIPFSFVLGMLFLGEHLGLDALLGSALIVAAGLVATRLQLGLTKAVPGPGP